MNRDDIIRMAREAGFWGAEETAPPPSTFDEQITIEEYSVGDRVERFAHLVAAAEREACAKVCELVAREIDDTNGTATYCADAIRARGQNES
jgi:hypothetical protein